VLFDGGALLGPKLLNDCLAVKTSPKAGLLNMIGKARVLLDRQT